MHRQREHVTVRILLLKFWLRKITWRFVKTSHLSFSGCWRRWRDCWDAGEAFFSHFLRILRSLIRLNTFASPCLLREWQSMKRCWWYVAFFTQYLFKHQSLTFYSALVSKWLWKGKDTHTSDLFFRLCCLPLLCSPKKTLKDSLWESLHSGTWSVTSFFMQPCPGSLTEKSPAVMWSLSWTRLGSSSLLNTYSPVDWCVHRAPFGERKCIQSTVLSFVW